VRTALGALAGLALAFAAPATAQIAPPGPLRGVTTTPVRTAPLAPGETLLELGAVGVASARADLATISISVGAEAPVFEDAQRLSRSRLARIREGMRGAGLPADAVQAGQDQPPGSHPQSFDIASNFNNSWSGDTVVIRIADIDRVAAARAALEAEGVSHEESAPVYTVSDDSAALRQARVRAIARIRADADAYAAARGMRVARIVRVSERNGTDLYRLAYRHVRPFRRGERDMFSGREGSPDIDTGVAVSVEFALAPL
jgi:uncharacterized protein YggE